MNKLTTHVLDTAHGIPAEGVKIVLYHYSESSDSKKQVKSVVTNEDGRSDEPLLNKDDIAIGKWELEFHIGDYYGGLGIELPEPKFLDVITINFGISSNVTNYHVPLLVSPWSYSTYRGS